MERQRRYLAWLCAVAAAIALMFAGIRGAQVGLDALRQLTLFKVATQVKQYKDRILLRLPSSCPVKALLQRVTTLLCVVPAPVCNTS